MKIGIVILSAGASARLGKPKQLLKFGEKTLLRRAAETALATNCRPVIAVLGAHAEIIKAEIADLPLQIVFNNLWQEGMSASIKAGLKECLRIEPGIEAVILMLCDQPFVISKTLARLIEAYQATKKPVAACEYNHTAGVPALFAREVFSELMNLQGEAGAKAVIKKFAASDLAKVAAPEATVDVDTTADYENLLFIRRDTLL
jgi:molybdenum cofactor cytidylyltransferase